MAYQRPPQKFISFTENKVDLDNIARDMKEGWSIISLMRNGSYYVGIMEYLQQNQNSDEDTVVFIPPRKKFKISK
jgi:hypothetical protein